MPLSETIFEECKVYVPNKIENVLVREYGMNVLKPKYKNGVKMVNGHFNF